MPVSNRSALPSAVKLSDQLLLSCLGYHELVQPEHKELHVSRLVSQRDTLFNRLEATLLRLKVQFTYPMYALPIDIFRILVGLLSFVYFLHILREAPEFSDPNGLLDHELIQQFFWYTRLSLFQSGITLPLLQLIFVLACVASLVLVLGYRVKLMAGLLFVVAVSNYRWNFLIMYVDDGVMHLLLFWLLLLPVGHTLVLREWLADRHGTFERWKHQLVPGAAVRCFLANLALLYVVAGLWKWASPMWRDGVALYAVLKLPIAHHPDFWQPAHLPLLKIGNYLALVLEPLIPLMFVLPTSHRLKWLLLPGLLGFHLGILATLKIPYANIALIAGTVIIFRNELMHLINKRSPKLPHGEASVCLNPSAKFSLLLVGCLTVAMIWDLRAPAWRAPLQRDSTGTLASGEVSDYHIVNERSLDDSSLEYPYNPMYAPLWLVGIAQVYRLFDWIDDRNFHITYDIVERVNTTGTRPIDPDDMFPRSLRSILLQSYLHDVVWTRIPSERMNELKISLSARFAGRYCRHYHRTHRIDVYRTIQRITADNLELNRGRRELLMQFECRDAKPRLYYVRLTRE
jgi:hypothetical protein